MKNGAVNTAPFFMLNIHETLNAKSLEDFSIGWV